ncbi:MAG TPA: hypothetical protein PLD59_12085 [Tepidisphaeraceae bacterium]|nr:hypothetical protein [Tepidisphaeraceae bacterium]
MSMAPPPPVDRPRILRLLVASIAFLIGAALIIVIVTRGYLRPAYEAWRTADPQQRSLLSASSILLLAVVLVVLLLLLITAFGVRRFFHFHQHGGKQVNTPYIDAWAESARRMKPKIDDSGQDGDGRPEQGV